MSALSQWILAALLSFQPGATTETPEDRLLRLEGVALALAHAVDVGVMTGGLPGHERRLWAAAAASTALRESSLALAVHAGERLGDGGQSICLMQIHTGNRAAYAVRTPFAHLTATSRDLTSAWRELAGLDPAATRRCAQAGVLSLVRMRAHCARRVPPEQLLAATLSAYMSGSSCAVSLEGQRRERLARRLHKLLDAKRVARQEAERLQQPDAHEHDHHHADDAHDRGVDRELADGPQNQARNDEHYENTDDGHF